MTTSKPLILQMFPFSPLLEAGLEERFEPVRWFDLHEDARARLIADRAPEVSAVVTAGHIGCPLEVMNALPNLGIIAIHGVGYDKVDIAAAQARGIRVTTTPNCLNEDVADLAVGLMISLLRNIPQADTFVRAEQWPKGDFPLARKVSGRHFGIVGLGNIGREIAKRLEAFGPVSYCGTRPKDVPYSYYPDAEALASAVDVLIVACPATQATQGLIGKAVLHALGEGGWLVNIARGSVVDERALIEALEQGSIAGAALDVFADEPNVPEALLQNPRTLLTPHIASATVEVRQRMAEIVLANLDDFHAGVPLRDALV